MSKGEGMKAEEERQGDEGELTVENNDSKSEGGHKQGVGEKESVEIKIPEGMALTEDPSFKGATSTNPSRQRLGTYHQRGLESRHALSSYSLVKYHFQVSSNRNNTNRALNKIYADASLRKEVPAFKLLNLNNREIHLISFEMYALLFSIFKKENQDGVSVEFKLDGNEIFKKLKEASFQEKVKTLKSRVQIFSKQASSDEWRQYFVSELNRDLNCLEGLMGKEFFYEAYRSLSKNIMFNGHGSRRNFYTMPEFFYEVAKHYYLGKRIFGYAEGTLYAECDIPPEAAGKITKYLSDSLEGEDLKPLDYLAARLPFRHGVSMRQAMLLQEGGQKEYLYITSADIEAAMTETADPRCEPWRAEGAGE